LVQRRLRKQVWPQYASLKHRGEDQQNKNEDKRQMAAAPMQAQEHK